MKTASIRRTAISLNFRQKFGHSTYGLQRNYGYTSKLCAVDTDSTSNIVIDVLDGTKGVSDSILEEASQFMMESFWNQDDGNDGFDAFSTSPLQSNLLSLQKMDLELRFGERLGKRLLPTRLITARSTSDDFSKLLGMVSVEAALYNDEEKTLLTYEQSEKRLKDAVSTLGPKQRRQYKDATLVELVTQLPEFNGKFQAVAVLCNLAVDLGCRGKGIGAKLCHAVERVSVNEFGLDPLRLMLKVEKDNTAAVKLYQKTGYNEESVQEDSVAIRADIRKGQFLEVPCTMLTLSKLLM